MTEKEILESIEDQLGNEVDPNIPFIEQGYDSLDLLEVCMVLEGKTGKYISDQKLNFNFTPMDFVNHFKDE